MADISERRIRPIHEALDSKNWKQALQLCEKWHKKGERSVRFLAIRASVLAQQPDTALANRGRAELLQLCNQIPAITQIDTIHQIQTALNDLKIAEDGANTLWQRAVAAKPDDDNLSMAWLEEAIDQRDWKAAQRATIALRKTSPKDRRYEFWSIFMCYMIFRDESIPEKERNMFGTLAYRMFSKAAGDDAHNTSQPSTKTIISPEEVLFLVQVYLDTGHVQEAKTLLGTSQRLGTDSSLAKLDPDLHTSVRLKLLQRSEDWSAIIAGLRDGLAISSSGDAQLSPVLDVLFKAAEHSEDFDLLAELRNYLESRLEISPASPTINHAMLRLRRIEIARDRCTADEFTKAFEHYFIFHGERLSWFDEIRGLVQGLDITLQEGFVHLAHERTVSEPDQSDLSVIFMLNALKLEYLVMATSNSSIASAEGFANKAIGIYQRTMGTRTKINEAKAQLAMLACMAISRAHDYKKQSGRDQSVQAISLLKSGFLLRYCLTNWKDDYPTLVVLLRFLMLLGGISLAARLFDILNVKNLQWENAGYLLLTRLSTLHPQPSRSLESSRFEPLQTLNLAIAANTNSVGSIQRHLVAGLNRESYINVMDSIALRENMNRSLGRQLHDVELDRIKRLRGLPIAEREIPVQGSFVDHRDTSFIPSFEHANLRSFADLLETGPKQKDGWLRTMTRCSQIADLAYKGYHDPDSIKHRHVQNLGDAIEELATLLTAAQDEFTTAELQNCEIQFCVGKALRIKLERNLSLAKTGGTAEPTDSHAKSVFDDLIDRLQAWLKETLQQQESSPTSHPGVMAPTSTVLAPSWQYLHMDISMLESLKLISLFLDIQDKIATPGLKNTSIDSKSSPKSTNRSLLPDMRRKEIQQLVVRAETSIHNSARSLREDLSAAGVLDKMVDALFDRGQSNDVEAAADGAAAGLGKELESLPGAEILAETFCAEVIESWIDALDGILSIKVGSRA